MGSIVYRPYWKMDELVWWWKPPFLQEYQIFQIMHLHSHHSCQQARADCCLFSIWCLLSQEWSFYCKEFGADMKDKERIQFLGFPSEATLSLRSWLRIPPHFISFSLSLLLVHLTGLIMFESSLFPFISLSTIFQYKPENHS